MLVKICCVSSVEEANIALESGAAAIGLVSKMPSGPGVISESIIAEIAAAIGDRSHSVLLTSLSDPASIASQFARCGVNALQLCEWLPSHDRATLRDFLPQALILQVVHVTGSAAVERARTAQDHVDALLLDSGTPNDPPPESVRELGGTGRTHDWTISQRICRAVDIPVFLAGGLNATNVDSAIRTVAPYGVDVCSGVRTNGNLDPKKLQAFMSEVRKAAQDE